MKKKNYTTLKKNKKILERKKRKKMNFVKPRMYPFTEEVFDDPIRREKGYDDLFLKVSQ